MAKKLKQAFFCIFIPLLCFGLFSGGCGYENNRGVHQQGKVKLCEVEVNGKNISAEVADNDGKRTKGLSGRRKLGKNSGMLFVFPNADTRVFWMKDCLLDLDIAYIDSNNIIKEIYTMKKQPLNIPDNMLKIYPSKSGNIMYALEMNAGWFKRNEVIKGNKVKILHK